MAFHPHLPPAKSRHGPAAPNGAWWQVVTCGNPPPFSFWGAKKKTAVEPSKEKTPVAAQLRARDAPCRAAGCGSKPFCSVEVVPAGARAGLSANFRTHYAVLHSEGIGQRPNLTSCSFRAFRFAKRCPGSRGAVPFWDGPCADSRPSLAAAGSDASLRAGWLGWLIGLSVGADAAIRIPRPQRLPCAKGAVSRKAD